MAPSFKAGVVIAGKNFPGFSQAISEKEIIRGKCNLLKNEITNNFLHQKTLTF